MRGVIAALAALFAVIGLSTAAATTASAEGSSASSCSTWQYKVTETADVYDVYYSDGSYYMVYDFTAYRGYYFNSKAPNTYFRNRIYGNAYNTGKNYERYS